MSYTFRENYSKICIDYLSTCLLECDHNWMLYSRTVVHTVSTRMHSSRMRTVRNSSNLLSGGGLHTYPQEQTPPGAGTPWSRHLPPKQAPPRSRPPRAGTPPLDTCCKACWDTCKNITFATLLLTVIKLTWLFSADWGTKSPCPY